MKSALSGDVSTVTLLKSNQLELEYGWEVCLWTIEPLFGLYSAPECCHQYHCWYVSSFSSTNLSNFNPKTIQIWTTRNPENNILTNKFWNHGTQGFCASSGQSKLVQRIIGQQWHLVVLGEYWKVIWGDMEQEKDRWGTGKERRTTKSFFVVREVIFFLSNCTYNLVQSDRHVELYRTAQILEVDIRGDPQVRQSVLGTFLGWTRGLLP